MSQKTHSVQRRFTLIELLVVIAIIAVIAGGVISAYSGMDQRAAASQSAQSVKALDQGIRNWMVMNKKSGISGLDSLLAGTYVAANTLPAANTCEVAKHLHSGLQSSMMFPVMTLTKAQVKALSNAGVTELYYIDKSANAATDGALLNSVAGYTFGMMESKMNPNITTTTSPNQAFDLGSHHGRGFKGLTTNADDMADTETCAVLTMDMMRKHFGAQDDHNLVIFGVGHQCNIPTDGVNKVAVSSGDKIA